MGKAKGLIKINAKIIRIEEWKKEKNKNNVTDRSARKK